ncbi:9195_t:CDS:1, partial [Racocetra persica]
LVVPLPRSRLLVREFEVAGYVAGANCSSLLEGSKAVILA